MPCGPRTAPRSSDSPFAADRAGRSRPRRRPSPFADAPPRIATEPVAARAATAAERGGSPTTVGLAALVATAGAGGAWAGATVLAPRTGRPGHGPDRPRRSATTPGPDRRSSRSPRSPSTPPPSPTPSSRRSSTSRSRRAAAATAPAQPVASGSGVVIDTDGHIVTNRHVVETGSSYRVVLSDGRTYDARSSARTRPRTSRSSTSTRDDLTPIALGSTGRAADRRHDHRRRQPARARGRSVAHRRRPVGHRPRGPDRPADDPLRDAPDRRRDHRGLQRRRARRRGRAGWSASPPPSASAAWASKASASRRRSRSSRASRRSSSRTATATTAGLGIQGQTAYADLADGGQQPKGVAGRARSAAAPRRPRPASARAT